MSTPQNLYDVVFKTPDGLRNISVYGGSEKYATVRAEKLISMMVPTFEIVSIKPRPYDKLCLETANER